MLRERAGAETESMSIGAERSGCSFYRLMLAGVGALCRAFEAAIVSFKVAHGWPEERCCHAHMAVNPLCHLC